MMAMGEMWSYLGSTTASLMFIYAIIQQYCPLHFKSYVETYVQKLVSFLYPYIQITFDEFSGERMKCSEAFSAIRIYLKDKHIEMSYCCFEAFKVLAKNYLDIDSHPRYEEIHRLLEETNMTPADVAECLMPKSDEDDEDTCLKALVEALEAAKEEARKKAEEEARLKSEKEVKEKEEVQLKAEKEETEKEKARLKAEREKEESPKENGKLEETPVEEVKDDGPSH
ncbi:hypothetical protein SLA2020_098680 [Shorea laevis]